MLFGQFEAAHWSEPCFQSAVVALDAVVIGYEFLSALRVVCRSGSRFRVVGFGVFGGIS